MGRLAWEVAAGTWQDSAPDPRRSVSDDRQARTVVRGYRVETLEARIVAEGTALEPAAGLELVVLW